MKLLDIHIKEALFKGVINPNSVVDLNLPSGTIWCKCNLGAKKETDFGDYYAWGEVETKDEYNADTYKWTNGQHWEYSKYNDNDKKYQLDDVDNPVIKKLGVKYDMPTAQQLKELFIHTDHVFDENTNCDIFISKHNGAKITFPRPGTKGRLGFKHQNEWGRYLSKNLQQEDECYCLGLKMGRKNENEYISIYDLPREYGYSIRPVKK